MCKINTGIFYHADLSQNISNKLIFIPILQMIIRNDLPHKLIALLLGYDIAPRKSIGIFEHHKKDCVKSSEGYRSFCNSHLPQESLFHLICRSLCECDDQYVGRIHVVFFYQLNGSLGDDSGFSRSRPRQYKHRAILMQDGRLL